ncbi:hypothetical protein P8452_50257 [Trifolium repens]|nr:hypothetical protein P8452_50257 [Trifolium repens]
MQLEIGVSNFDLIQALLKSWLRHCRQRSFSFTTQMWRPCKCHTTTSGTFLHRHSLFASRSRLPPLRPFLRRSQSDGNILGESEATIRNLHAPDCMLNSHFA